MKTIIGAGFVFLLLQFTALPGQDTIKPVAEQYPKNLLKAMPFVLPTPAGVMTSLSGGFEHFVNKNNSFEVVGVAFRFFSFGGTGFSDHGPMFGNFNVFSVKPGYNHYFRFSSAPNFSFRLGTYAYAKFEFPAARIQAGAGGLFGARINLYRQRLFLDLAMGISVFYAYSYSFFSVGPRPIIHFCYAL